MNANNTYNQKLNVYIDGQLTKEFEPSIGDKAKQAIKVRSTKAKNKIKTEIRMIVFDTIHRTHYRRIKHKIDRDNKRRAFESSIGLVRV